jgi:hypothetical protein
LYAEVIYEPGSKSLVSYEDEGELKAALKEHHNRARSGELGGPAGGPAERVSKVILYNEHPGEDRTKVDPDTLQMLASNVKSGEQLVSAIREELSPVYPQDQGRHNSMYKMDGSEMNLSFLDGDA